MVGGDWEFDGSLKDFILQAGRGGGSGFDILRLIRFNEQFYKVVGVLILNEDVHYGYKYLIRKLTLPQGIQGTHIPQLLFMGYSSAGIEFNPSGVDLLHMLSTFACTRDELWPYTEYIRSTPDEVYVHAQHIHSISMIYQVLL